MEKHIDLLINPKKIYIPKHKNNKQNINDYKSSLIKNINNHHINFNRDIDSNTVLDLLYFIEFYNKFKNCLCNDCIEKINKLN